MGSTNIPMAKLTVFFFALGFIIGPGIAGDRYVVVKLPEKALQANLQDGEDEIDTNMDYARSGRKDECKFSNCENAIRRCCEPKSPGYDYRRCFELNKCVGIYISQPCKPKNFKSHMAGIEAKQKKIDALKKAKKC